MSRRSAAGHHRDAVGRPRLGLDRRI